MALDPRLVTGRIIIGGALAGTAWRTKPTLAVTAAHCVVGFDSCEIEFAKDGGGFLPKVPARVVQPVDAARDIALLEFAEQGPFIELATLPWDDDRVVGDHALRWQAFGYPDAKQDGLAVRGDLTSVGERDTYGLELTCDQGGYGDRNSFLHLSGSPVVVRERAIGLILSNPPKLAQRVLYARPSEAVASLHPKLSAHPHPAFRVGSPLIFDKPHLDCDRDSQWGQFQTAIDSNATHLFVVKGHVREATEKFAERIEHAASRPGARFDLAKVTWPGGNTPRSTAADYCASLSNAIFDDELSPPALAEALRTRSGRKLVILHPEVDLSSDLVRDSLDSLVDYYYEVLPKLLGGITRTWSGVVLVQPLKWLPRGLGRWLPSFSAKSTWENRVRNRSTRPVVDARVKELEPITDDDIRRFLPKVHVEDIENMTRDIVRQGSSDKILNYLRGKWG